MTTVVGPGSMPACLGVRRWAGRGAKAVDDACGVIAGGEVGDFVPPFEYDAHRELVVAES